ncbi:hypothetical protein BCR44DRAFT_1083581 [Catenaria anguillulae PL171]|uniref:Uncharacterized protein n=1 Tax=Catenaria anguillulae PL171 TaxID=765915 RepID=A0A1Y2HNJ4_9FUNG|nr:hypothetical protein BCR44DRAFT_1083581 [Catenaria anguillulae PL171]
MHSLLQVDMLPRGCLQGAVVTSRDPALPLTHAVCQLKDLTTAATASSSPSTPNQFMLIWLSTKNRATGKHTALRACASAKSLPFSGRPSWTRPVTPSAWRSSRPNPKFRMLRLRPRQANACGLAGGKRSRPWAGRGRWCWMCLRCLGASRWWFLGPQTMSCRICARIEIGVLALFLRWPLLLNCSTTHELCSDSCFVLHTCLPVAKQLAKKPDLAKLKARGYGGLTDEFCRWIQHR